MTRRAAAAALGLALLGAPFPGLVPARAQATFECPATAAATPGAVAAVASPAAPATLDAAFPDGGGNLTVFAAASLTDAFGEIKTDLEEAHPGLAITYNFAGSQALVTQLGEGAQADVFASANITQMKAAQDKDLISGDPVTFVENQLVIVTPPDNPAGIDSPDDLGAPGLRLVLAQADVPVGRYAREAVCGMGQDTATFGDDFVGRVAANVVSEEEDVRDVLAKVQLGEADAGIAYVSDAFAGGDQVQQVEIPASFNILATYPISTVSGGDEALGEAFITYVLSEDGQDTLADYGFDPIS
ncbi:MAG: molybdate ABC transporter substrate-binding protein [Chloroflexota bacterium]|nr:molybdate ABC transporter substrate-binding protein [Chloroflexota bacterium]